MLGYVGLAGIGYYTVKGTTGAVTVLCKFFRNSMEARILAGLWSLFVGKNIGREGAQRRFC